MLEKFLIPSPIQALSHPLFERKGLKVWLKRDDLTHPEIGGNKWRKLKYNLEAARQEAKSTLLTFGGAYSNHLYATAAAGALFGFQTIGIVRGEAPNQFHHTLRQAQAFGMQLHFVSRQTYTQKADLLPSLQLDPDSLFILPEGGTNPLAMRGCMELAEEILTQDLDPDFVCICCGTGGTAAGLIAGLNDQARVLGFSVLKGDFLHSEIATHLNTCKQNGLFPHPKLPSRWKVLTEYHHGGYARYTQALIDFINNFSSRYQVAFDPVYTGKLVFGVFDLIEKDYFSRGDRILLVHSGGQQGIMGFNERYGQLINPV